MISWLALAPVITAASSPVGLFFVQRLGGSLNRQSDRFLSSLWVGLVVIATVLMGAALVVPLTPSVGLLVAATTTGGALLSSPVRYEVAAWLGQARLWALWIASIAMGGVLGIQPVVQYDTGLYHYQSIRWLAEHGTVSGLALIHERFGFASSYFALHAPLDSGLLQGRSPNILASFALALAVAHVIVGVVRLTRGTARLSDVVTAAGMLVNIGLARATELTASASPDHLAVYLPVAAAWLMLISAENDPAVSSYRTDGLVWLLAVLSFNVKPNLLPVAATAFLWALWRSSQRIPTAIWMTTVAVAATIPLLLTHVTLSGCLLFPAAFTCVDASGVDPETAQQTSDIVRDWARWNGPTPTDADTRSWISDWLASRPAGGIVEVSATVALLVASLAASIGRQRGLTAPITLSFLGIGFVLATSPAFRFMAGYLALAVGLGAGAVRAKLFTRRLDRLGAAASALALAGLLTPALPNTTWLLPAELGGHSTTHIVHASGWSYLVPVNDDRCWDAEIPCIPYKRTGVVLRSSSIAGGFTR